MKFTYKVILRPDFERADGTRPIWLQVFVNTSRIRINLMYAVENKNFDEKTQQVVGLENLELQRQINTLIAKAKKKCQDIFYFSQLEGYNLTKERFMIEYNKDMYDKTSFTAFIEKEIENTKDKTANTIKSYHTFFNHFKTFRKNVNFGDLNYNLVADFDAYLRNVKPKLEQNTIHKRHTIFKKFINVALDKGHKFENPYLKFKVSTVETQIEYLTFEELKRLIALYNSKQLTDKLQNVLRYYLFSATCGGLRFSDIEALTAKNIEGKNLCFVPIKTKNSKVLVCRVPITKVGQMLVLDAKTHIKNKNTLFGCYSNQKTNEYLKELAVKAAINKDFSFHSARHTFATLFYAHTKDIATLSRILGHSNIKQTQVYVSISDEQKISRMSDFDSLF